VRSDDREAVGTIPDTIPLLKRLHLMLIRFDIKLLPVQVGSKTNARADALSEEFSGLQCSAAGLFLAFPARAIEI
jgi:hypothetical protein